MDNRRESFRGRAPRASSPEDNRTDRQSSSRPAGPPSAREIVSRRLAEQAAAFPEFVITPLQTGTLDERDAALAHAIHDAVIRRWLTLGFMLNRHTRQPLQELEPAMQGVLLAGSAQLLFFDRLPVHAVLNETVELAKRLVREGAAGMVNAVLRRIAEVSQGPDSHLPRPDDWASRRDLLPLADGRALRLADEILPEEPLERLAIATSHPPGLVRRWSTRHRRDHLQNLLLHTLVSPPTILNTAHAAKPLPPSLLSHSSRGHHVYQGSRSELLALLEERDDLWVQDAASSRAVAAVAKLSPPPQIVVDMCAGQGTKTRQLASIFPEARIIATDVDEQRYRTLADVFSGHPRVEAVPHEQLRAVTGAQADLVLLDVPCSNTGVLARRPEARYRADRQQLTRLQEVQRKILIAARALLRSTPRGRIVYSTCSIDRKENELQADWATSELSLKIEKHELLLPAGLPGDDAREYHDGSFFAILA